MNRDKMKRARERQEVAARDRRLRVWIRTFTISDEALEVYTQHVNFWDDLPSTPAGREAAAFLAWIDKWKKLVPACRISRYEPSLRGTTFAVAP